METVLENLTSLQGAVLDYIVATTEQAVTQSMVMNAMIGKGCSRSGTVHAVRKLLEDGVLRSERPRSVSSENPLGLYLYLSEDCMELREATNYVFVVDIDSKQS